MSNAEPTPSLVLASGNRGKVAEIQHMLEGVAVTVKPQSEFGVSSPEETGLTFLENALLKARHASQATGCPALADDSGLAVDALGGAPGIHSARYAGADGGDAANNAKLLAALEGHEGAQRSAAFHCLMVYLSHPRDPVPLVAEGRWPGYVLEAPRGSQGFGYDPLFYVPDYRCSAAELAPETKNRVSHRGQALAALSRRLTERLAPRPS